MLAPGLLLRRMDWRDLQGAALHSAEAPGLYLILMLTGGADITVDGITLARKQSFAGHALMWGATRPIEIQRQSRRGDIERCLMLSLTPQWLQSRFGPGNALRQLAAQHVQPARWRISRSGLASVQQILHPPEQAADLLQLYFESRVLELLREAAVALAEPLPDSPSLSRRKFLRMVQVRELLESGGADDWTLQRLAAEHHLSVNTLQRHFRAAWDSTVDDYRRDARLRRARAALERDGVPVAKAAEIAGYNNAANFATAFRRAYGMSPSQASARQP